MRGFLLIAPTGSGKSWACKNERFFIENAIDGDDLIDWDAARNTTDWTVKDRQHLETVFTAMRNHQKCVCWYVGTTAVADAIDECRISRDDVGIVLIPPDQHQRYVNDRKKIDHDWKRAIENRQRCESLVEKYGLFRFDSFQDAVPYVRMRLQTPMTPNPADYP